MAANPLDAHAPTTARGDDMKPMLTKEQLDDYFRSDRISSHAYNTIEAAVELLTEPCTCHIYGTERDSMGAWICKPCYDKQTFLATYHGTSDKGVTR